MENISPSQLDVLLKTIDAVRQPIQKRPKLEEDEPLRKIEVIEQRDGGEHLVLLTKSKIEDTIVRSGKLVYIPQRRLYGCYNGETFFAHKRDQEKYGDCIIGMKFPFTKPGETKLSMLIRYRFPIGMSSKDKSRWFDVVQKWIDEIEAKYGAKSTI